MIKISNLKKSLKKQIIFEKVNINFCKGKIYGLTGINGSGKSIFLKTICGFLVPDEGNVIVDDIDIFKNNQFIPNTRVLIDKPSFIDDLTGFENLKLLAEIQNIIDDQVIRDWIRKLNLDENKKYKEYSLGMKQKLAIIQTIMENQKIIILDEPFNGLDKKSHQQMINILNEIKKDKIIIIASHIEKDINELCDEVYEIEEGCIKKVA